MCLDFQQKGLKWVDSHIQKKIKNKRERERKEREREGGGGERGGRT